MRTGWQIRHLDDVCEIDKSQGIYEGLPYVGMEDMSSASAEFLGSSEPKQVKSSTFKFSEEHLLYGRLRPYLNKVLVPDFSGHCSTEIFPIKPKPELEKRYLLYWFLKDSTVESINATCTGARMPRANMKEVMGFEFLLPPLPEQKRIVAILDEAFAGISQAVANAEKNLANARELFESYLNNVFTQKGEGWVEKELGDTDLLQIIDGDRGKNYPKKTDFSCGGHCLFLNTKNVRPDGFSFDTKMFITEEKDNVLRKGKLQRRDVLLTTRGTIGNIAIYDDSVEYDHIRINSGMLIFRPNEKVISSEYLFEIMRSSIMKEQITKFTSGAAQPQLPIKTLVNFTLPVPISLEEQEKMVSCLRNLLQQTQRLEFIYQQKLTALAELKQSILQKAFAGELTAGDKLVREEAVV